MPMTRYLMSTAAVLKGDLQLAQELSDAEPEEMYRLQSLALVLEAQGKHREAEEKRQEMIDGYAVHSPYAIATLFAHAGLKDEAFAWMERSRVEGDGTLGEMVCDRLMTTLTDDPRWDEMLEKIGLKSLLS